MNIHSVDMSIDSNNYTHMYLEPSEYRLWLQLVHPLGPTSGDPLQDNPSPTWNMENTFDNSEYIHLAAVYCPWCVL